MKKLKIVALTFAVFLLAGCGGTDYAKLEKEFVTKAYKFYEDNLKDKVINVSNHSVSLEALELTKVDITSFTKEKCDKTSYVLVKTKLDDQGKPVGDLEAEVHLTCGDYTSK